MSWAFGGAPSCCRAPVELLPSFFFSPPGSWGGKVTVGSWTYVWGGSEFVYNTHKESASYVLKNKTIEVSHLKRLIETESLFIIERFLHSFQVFFLDGSTFFVGLNSHDLSAVSRSERKRKKKKQQLLCLMFASFPDIPAWFPFQVHFRIPL